jgi:hypothetical protein
MTTGDRTEDRDETQREQYPMHRRQLSEHRFQSLVCTPAQAPVEE